jgi:hypothetical protein
MKRKIFNFSLISLLLFTLASCGSCCGGSQSAAADEDFRTTPVTNNPNIVPNTASAIPGMPSTPAPGMR